MKINLRSFLLAFIVILSFAAVGIAIAYQNLWAIFGFIMFGCVVMGYGLFLKRKMSEK
mgnify:CR=1 FL=1